MYPAKEAILCAYFIVNLHFSANRNNNNNNNNNNNDDDEDEDDDPGTEIAFVLDGSGSIDPPDFEHAKEFIVKVMNNTWAKCFDCNFAVVQYGNFARTELSLKENDNATKAIGKIPGIEQITRVTVTATAINHVLEQVFVPENGSKAGAKKFIIVVTDGVTFQDDMNLTTVLQKPEMKGITRFAIGVGPDVLAKDKALKEMREIASDPDDDHFFGVDNYNALSNILSRIEQGIVGIEGTNQGVGFQYELAEAGFSSHIALDRSLLFGAVGAFDWSGGMIVKYIQTNKTAFLNVTNSEPKTSGKEQRFSYLGYSVTSAQNSSETLYLSGAPRYNLTGGVFVFNGQTHKLQQSLLGDQVGSYFGSVLCVLNVEKDNIQKTDYLLVGAPYFHRDGEEGKVYVYKLHQHGFQKQDWEWSGLPKYAFARFGSAIANIGDIDGNNYNDVAVGAPLEEGDSGTSGSIYIYNGFSDGLHQQHSQRISAAEMGMTLKYFGQSVSPMAEAGPNRQEYISVGSEGKVSVFKTLPVVVLEPKISTVPSMIPLSHQASVISEKLKIKLKICFDAPRKPVDVSSIPILYHIDLDDGQAEKHLTFSDNKASRQDIFDLTPDIECIPSITLLFLPCFDCFSPIQVKLNFSLQSNSATALHYVLDAFTPTEISAVIPFERECKQEPCQANISLSDSQLSKNKIIIGDTQYLDISFNLINTGYSSYKTTLTLAYPNVLLFFKISKRPERSFSCENKVGETFSELKCKLFQPIFRRSSKAIFTLSWQLRGTKSDLKTAEIRATLANDNNGTQILGHRNFTFGIKNALKVELEGEASPTSLKNEDKADTKPLEIKFQPQNKDDANLNITITIKLETTHTRVFITKISPQSACISQHGGEIKGERHIQCIQTDLEEITINMEVHISEAQEKDEQIVVKGELGFDQNTYVALDGSQLKKEVTVTIRKLTVVKSMPAIIGGSVGGFVFLAIIIIILIKCGFFRRRHQVDQGQNGG
ncbi:integrin alpha-E [Clupea harengus]|uniref:Integrin alpha-E n=1 Tax=Clupea harengus TaxID=7950 RepID=A0A6P8FKB5_CLUHA|nr:integrin alpha-E [Clupea harengus]